VSDERPPERPVSHRAPVSRGQSLRRLLPPFAAVSAVVVVIVLLLWLNGRSTPSGGPALDSPTPVLSTSAAPAPSPTSHTPRPTPSRTTPSPTHSSTPAVVAKAPVDVLNNSTRSGLAHDVARQVANVGWPIDVIGNFTGQVAESTLYYDRGQLTVAQQLAHDLPAIRRVLPRFTGLPGSGLTLVVTRDWPS
jgi:hypothetical protein